MRDVLTSSMKHPIKEVFNRGNMIFALNWYFLAQALNTGAATVPEEETLLSWLDQLVSSDNPDDVIEVHKLQEPVFVRLGPRGLSLDLSGPFLSKGPQRMLKGAL